ncbi:YncE family protein [Falsiroseomonas sp. CW058]|uniref:YncE family protein n=1 Tax=Falsiroseomonas sp. CW058 TaxID=3388664 RepID=UPI003D31CD6B
MRWLLAASLLLAAPAGAEQPAGEPFRATHAAQGLAVTLELAAVAGGPAVAGEPALLRLRFATGGDPAGPPARFLRPAAWAERDAGRSASCHDRVQGLLQPRIGLRAEADFNAWQLAVLADNGALHVLDPLGGSARSRLLAVVNLRGRGAALAVDAARDAAFVSVPAAGEIVEVDTLRWIERRRIAAGDAPGALLADADGATLWAAAGEAVLRIDRASGEVRARLPVGFAPRAVVPLGPGAVLAAGEGGAALLRGHAALQLPGLGDGFAAAAWSPLAEVAVLLDARAGRLLAVTTEGQPAGLWQVAPGAAEVALDPTGRLALVPEPGEAQVTVVDLARGAVAHRVALDGAAPAGIGFSRTQAFVRSADGARIALLPLAALAGDAPPAVAWISAGDAGMQDAAGPTVLPAPDGNAMLIADGAQPLVHVYTEGMAAPSGTLRGPPGRALALLPVDRALREVAPGLHEAVTIFPRAGRHALPVMLQGGGFLHCFAVEIGGGPPEPLSARLGFDLAAPDRLVAGAPALLRLRLRGPEEAAAAWMGAADLRARLVQFDGHWQEVVALRPVGDGVYAAEAVAPPRAGPLLLHLESGSLGLRPGTLPHLNLRVGAP